MFNSSTGIKKSYETWLSFLVGGMSALAIGYGWHQRRLRQALQQAEERRREERTGRIRAEVRLRQLTKEKTAMELQMPLQSSMGNGNANASSADGTTDTNANGNLTFTDHAMKLQCIGTVVSPYTKRMGTPRQGALVPSSRAFIDLQIPTQALEGLEAYSHLWIIFQFHANTNIFQKKTKVRPPRAPHKVGQLATRSPHRPNPLGLSLVQMDRLDAKHKRLYISGIDLVHGTPVYDIKPCVPWDIPGYNGNNNDEQTISELKSLVVPEWVDQNDVIETVRFTDVAQQSLAKLLEEGRLAPLYTQENQGLDAATATLREVLAQDPRSSHKGLKVNQRGSNSAKETYSLVFGQTQVEFQVQEWGVQVLDILPIDFDDDAYVEGIPLMSEQQTKK